MASLRDRVFTLAEMREQVNFGRRMANYSLNKNKQHSFENYENLSNALDQAIAEIERLQKLVPQEK